MKIGEIVVGTFIALGLRFNQPRLIDGPRRTKLQAMTNFLVHEQALQLQEIFGRTSPYVRLLRGGEFPTVESETRTAKVFIKDGVRMFVNPFTGKEQSCSD